MVMNLFSGFAASGILMIVLTIVRVCTIITLGSVMTSCWVLAIKIDMSKPWFFFDAASLVFMSGICLFLVLSELPFGKAFFMNHWPAFSARSSLGWLGLALVAIGCNILGKLNNSNVERKNIGGPWYSLVLASGILSLIMGVLNLIGTLASIPKGGARQVRSWGNQEPIPDDLPYHKSIDEEKSPIVKPLKIFKLFRGRSKNSFDIPGPEPTSAYRYPESNAASRGGNPASHHSGRRSSDDLEFNPVSPTGPPPPMSQHPAFATNYAESVYPDEEPSCSKSSKLEVPPMPHPAVVDDAASLAPPGVKHNRYSLSSLNRWSRQTRK
ncbi:uncharacterized protein F5Z01DRAFT_648853 [Emericellopsis atlantica]|uniref:DUF7598 domain-containing protein n=1 Tax=Emericellopsis atlantica TaxID=2614577 RepID=A0A9P7ZQX5_9HYPO|nr:uncharacterized protein F5Z01DRAFT_648853 [Emericellopsis atlantica]KAG9256658.1 hypothetical protein F5Z01DRAFT_648853 [Emericellopsis atlantica]